MAGRLPGRLIDAWRSPRASWRAESGRGEPRLLAYGFAAALFLTLGPVLAEMIRPTEASAEDRLGWVAARIFVGLSFGVLSLYAVAGLVALIARLFGGALDGRRGRTTLFWSAFASGPAACVAHAAGAFVGATAIGAAAAGVVWCVLLAPMIAEAYDFALSRVVIAFSLFAALAFALRSLA